MTPIVITVGHRPGSEGAVASDGAREYTWCGVLADQLGTAIAARGYPCEVLRRKASGNGQAAWADVVRRVNALDPILCVELHYNASERHAMTGTECLHWPSSERGARLAARLAAVASACIGTRDRGAKPQRVSWAGAPLLILRDTRCTAVLLETHFGDVASDHDAATAARDSLRLAAALADALVAALAAR